MHRLTVGRNLKPLYWILLLNLCTMLKLFPLFSLIGSLSFQSTSESDHTIRWSIHGCWRSSWQSHTYCYWSPNMNAIAPYLLYAMSSLHLPLSFNSIKSPSSWSNSSSPAVPSICTTLHQEEFRERELKLYSLIVIDVRQESFHILVMGIFIRTGHMKITCQISWLQPTERVN